MTRARIAPADRLCARCGRGVRAGAAHWPGGYLCATCHTRALETYERCAGCGADRLTPGIAGDGGRLCTDCAGGLGDFFCQRCGREARGHRRRICGTCVLTERLHVLLDDGTGRIRPELAPFAGAFCDMRRPRSGVTWIGSQHVQRMLRTLAGPSTPITHETLNTMTPWRPVAYLRDLLMLHGVLPPADRNLLLFERWLAGTLARIDRRAEALIEQFEIDARPDALVAQLGQSTRALIAIARACQDMALHAGGARGLLILDEPTATLPAHEVELLLSKLRSYADRGASIVYVSHRIDEVLRITDRVTALRDGRVVSTVATGALREHDLVELIVGAAVDKLAPATAARPAATRSVLDVDGLSVGCLRDISFSVSAGEVVGIAGLLGSGRSTLLRCLFGVQQPRSGGFRINGVATRPRNVREAIRSGIAYVPESRADAGFFDLPIEHNLIAARVPAYRSGPRLRHRRARQDATALIRQFGIDTASPRAELATLSGGNQQKVILARWLSTSPAVLLLDEPDQGVDVGARTDIWQLVRSAAAGGMGVVVVTSDLEELARVVDRAIVIDDGAVLADVPKSELSAKRLTHLVYFGNHRLPDPKEPPDAQQ